MTKYYSVDDELFFPEKSDVFDVLHGNNRFVIGETYYEANGDRVTADVFAYDPDFITEHFDDMLFDIVGDDVSINTFLDISEVARLELQQLLVTWIDKHIDLTPYAKIVGESVQLHVTSDDIKDYKK